MSRAGFGRHPCMGNAKGAMFQDARAKKGSERARGGCIVGERDRRIWVRVGERLKCLVCTESVTLLLC
jgi:hypothetical protein